MEFSFNPKGHQRLQTCSKRHMRYWKRIKCWKLTGSPHLVFGGGKDGKWASTNAANGRISKCNILFVLVSLCSPNLSLWILYCFLLGNTTGAYSDSQFVENRLITSKFYLNSKLSVMTLAILINPSAWKWHFHTK